MMDIVLRSEVQVVSQLQLHLPNMHYVTYDGFGNLENVVSRPSPITTLIKYFEMNRIDPDECMQEERAYEDGHDCQNASCSTLVICDYTRCDITYYYESGQSVCPDS
uniref:Uncharacterized protein n=1 Tax=Oryza glaberrima TaxID=4538 RepID=I1NZF8_ORYGL